MFQIRDTDAKLTLTLDIEPDPRDPRLVLDSLFHVVTWTAGLGDAHDWASPAAFHAAITSEIALILSLTTIRTRGGPVLVQSSPDRDRIVGYAFVTWERLCIAFNLDEITPEIRDETVMEAEAICLGELQAIDDYINGQVYRYVIRNARRECLEARSDLYGEDHARHIAQTAFDRHLYSVAMDG